MALPVQSIRARPEHRDILQTVADLLRLEPGAAPVVVVHLRELPLLLRTHEHEVKEAERDDDQEEACAAHQVSSRVSASARQVSNARCSIAWRA